MSGPQATQNRPIGQASGVNQAPAQGGTPHIPISGDQLQEYVGFIKNRYQSSDLHGFQTRPAPTSSIAEATTTPEVQITKLDINRDVNVSEVSAPISTPLGLAEGADPLEAIAALAQGIDPELAQLAQLALDERALLSQGAQ